MSAWRSLAWRFISGVSGPIESSPSTSSVTPWRRSLSARPCDEGLFRVRQHVDEPGRHRLAARLDALGRRPGSERSHVDDAIAPQGYVAHERWAPRAVVH